MAKQQPSAVARASATTGVGCAYSRQVGRVVMCSNKEAWLDWTMYMTKDGIRKITTESWCGGCPYRKKIDKMA